MKRLTEKMKEVSRLEFQGGEYHGVSFFTEVATMKDTFKVMYGALRSFNRFVPPEVVRVREINSL